MVVYSNDNEKSITKSQPVTTRQNDISAHQSSSPRHSPPAPKSVLCATNAATTGHFTLKLVGGDLRFFDLKTGVGVGGEEEEGSATNSCVIRHMRFVRVPPPLLSESY